MMALDQLSAPCPHCGSDLWARRAGEWTLKQRIVKVDDEGGVRAKCDCGHEVSIPWLTVSAPPPIERIPGAPRVRAVDHGAD